MIDPGWSRTFILCLKNSSINTFDRIFIYSIMKGQHYECCHEINELDTYNRFKLVAFAPILLAKERVIVINKH